MDVFEKALGTGRHKICYNGDLTSEEDVRNLSEQFPEVESIMIGRGVLADPAIARKIKGGDGADKAEMRHFMICYMKHIARKCPVKEQFCIR